MGNGKLTPEMRRDCVEMRLRGCTLQQIATKYRVSRAAINQNLCKDLPADIAMRKFGTANVEKLRRKCVYPGLLDWMEKNDVSPNVLARESGCTASTYIYKMLSGHHEPRKRNIDKVLAYTGLTYEQAFGGRRE